MVIDKKTLRWIFGGVIGCIVLYWLLHETERVKTVIEFVKHIVSPFVVGAALAFILNVPMHGVEKRLMMISNQTVRRALALVLTLVLIALVLYLVFLLLLPQVFETIQTLIQRLPVFFESIVVKANELLQDNPEVTDWVMENTDLESVDWSSLIENVVSVVGNSASLLIRKAFSAIGSVSSGVFNAVISVVFAIYCLMRKEILARQGKRLLYAFLPERFCDHTVRLLGLTNRTFSNFISGQCLEALILGTMFAIAMLIFKMPYIPLVSVLIAVTALVPIVGAFVGCGLGAFFIFVDDPLLAVWFVVMFLVIQQIEGNVIYPKVVGSSVGLPGMWVLLAVTVGGELMGVAGMLLMIPLTSVLYTVLRELTRKRLEERGIDNEKLTVRQPEPKEGFKWKWPYPLRKKKEEQEDPE